MPAPLSRRADQSSRRILPTHALGRAAGPSTCRARACRRAGFLKSAPRERGVECDRVRRGWSWQRLVQKLETHQNANDPARRERITKESPITNDNGETSLHTRGVSEFVVRVSFVIRISC